jgi:hypothetical protein
MGFPRLFSLAFATYEHEVVLMRFAPDSVIRPGVVLAGLLLVLCTFGAQAQTDLHAARAVLHGDDLFLPAPASMAKLPAVPAASVMTATLRDGSLAAMRSAPRVRIEHFPLPGGGSADLELSSFTVLSPQSVFVSMTAAGEVSRPAPDITLYRGSAVGDAQSRVYLAVTGSGFSGTLLRDGVSYNIATQSAAPGNPVVLTVFESSESTDAYECGVDDDLFVEDYLRGNINAVRKSSAAMDTLKAVLAVDADYEAFQHYGGVDKTEEYIIARLGGVAAIYEKDLAITFEIGYMRVWETEDPYDGASDKTALDSFTNYWSENMGHVERTLATLISRKPISAPGVTQGLAWVNQLCSTRRGYAYVKFSKNDNFIKGHDGVWAHELGHNFGSPHTHSCLWNPPIDSCYTAEPVSGQSACFSDSDIHLILGGGELMSYCHMRFGGENKLNIFRDRVGALVRGNAERAECMSTSSTVRSLDLTEPAGGETYCAGTDITLRWDATGTNNFRILLSVDGGVNYDSVLVENLPRTTREWTWRIPADWPVGDQYRFRIEDMQNETLVDQMDGSFSTREGTYIVDQVTWRNVCVGEGAWFWVQASGSGDLTYQWKKNGVELPGETTNELQLEGLQVSDNLSTFTCVVTGDCGAIESEPALLKVFTSAVIVQDLVSDTACVGESAEFSIVAEGSNLHYKWYWRNVSGDSKWIENDTSVLRFENVKLEDEGSLRCEISSSCGLAISRTRYLIIPDRAVEPLTPAVWGEAIPSGGTYRISWKQFCLSSVKIEYTIDGGTTWNLITGSFDADAEFYLWNVPETKTKDGYFRISDADNPGVMTQSKLFEIKDMPALSFEPASVGFGWVGVGNTSDKPLTLRNDGRADLQVSRTEIAGTTQITITNGAPFTVPAGESYDLMLSFTPTAAARVEGTVKLTHNALGSPTIIDLLGEGFITTSAGNVPAPLHTMLYQNYPNPVAGSGGLRTMIAFDLARTAQVTLRLYNMLGEQVATLYSGTRAAGRHELHIALPDLPAGSYICRMTAGASTLSRTLQIVR